MYRLPVSDVYCDSGADDDMTAIFFPIMGQYIPNVAGWGGDAAKDEFGRPIVLVMGISVPVTWEGREAYDHQSIILHELVHGLGFGIWNFQNSFTASGEPRQIVELQPVQDVDGSVDEVWFVVSERTLDVARSYFNCSNLTRLPLMGENQLGAASRGSHWETRIMNDEFMAYGEGSSVSAITLAIMEDMGNYMSNYSNAECMTWGARQGCEFVETRCGTRRNDLSLTMSATGADSHCNRHYKQSYGGTVPYGENTQISFPPNQLLLSKCGSVHCANCPTSGSALDTVAAQQCEACASSGSLGSTRQAQAHPECWRPWGSVLGSDGVVGNGVMCNAECLDMATASTSEIEQLNCGTVPSGVILAAGRSSARSAGEDAFLSDTVTLYSICGLLFVVAIGMLAFSLLQKSNYASIAFLSIAINVVTISLGGVLLSWTLWLTYGDLDMDEVTGAKAVKMLMALAITMIVWGLYGIAAICWARRDRIFPMFIFVLVLFLIICAQSVGFFTVVVWIKDSYSIEAEQYATLGDGDGAEHIAGEKTRTGINSIDTFLDDSMKKFEAFTCNTYRKCCFDVHSVESSGDSSVHWQTNSSMGLTEANVTTCTQAHGGASVGGAAQELSDPSSPNFCKLISGSTFKRKGSELICVGFEKTGVLDRSDESLPGSLITYQY